MARRARRVSDGPMTSRRPLILAVAAAAAFAPAAAAQTPPPTLQWDHECYTEDQSMTFTGTGFTPGGAVDLLFSKPPVMLGSYETVADSAGAISGFVRARDADVLGAGENRALLGATANDRTRIDQGGEPDSQFAASAFTFTRWNGFSPGRYVPGRKVRVEAYGWAFAAGKPLYFLFQRNGKTVASVGAGRLSEGCGDRIARIRVPAKLRPGAYRLVLSTERRRPTGFYTWRKGRVVRRAAASTAGADRAMARG
jgi:hypothetical protein